MIKKKIRNSLFAITFKQLIIIIFIIPLISSAQGKWVVQNPKPTEAFLLKVEAVSDNNVWIGGLGGTLLHTFDKGENWNVEKMSDMMNILGISFKDSLNGWIIDSQSLLSTNNGGDSWEKVDIDIDFTKYSFVEIICFNEAIFLFVKNHTAIAYEKIDADSFVLKSIDGGQSWEQISANFPGQILTVQFLNEKLGFLYLEVRLDFDTSCFDFYKTEDGGNTWSKKRSYNLNRSRNMHFFNELEGFVGTFYTGDGGETWENNFPHFPYGTETVYFEDSLNGWVTDWEKIYKTSDGGNSWDSTGQGGTHRLMSIDFTSERTGWIVGFGGNILKKDPHVDIWQDMSQGTKYMLYDIAFLDEQTGWCVGNGGTILYTNNGGEIWSEQNSGTRYRLVSCFMHNDLVGWIVGLGDVLHTTDGGKNWIKKDGFDRWYSGITFFDDKNGLLFEYYGDIYKTTDGGDTWFLDENLSFGKNIKSISIVNETEVWIGGSNRIGHIKNKGEEIKLFDVPAIGQIENIQFLNEHIGFLNVSFGGFFKTEDGGNTWIEIMSSDDDFLTPSESFYMTDSQNGWIYKYYMTGQIQQIQINENNAFINSSYDLSIVQCIEFLNPNLGWAVGAGGAILKYTNDNSTNITKNNTSIKKVNIYPNPIETKGANIIFFLSKSQNIKVEVFDLIGRKVETIFNGIIDYGEIKLYWKPKKIASGLYIINIVSDEIKETRRCIYIN
ncbi:MAG: T9SS type A sorting domain-containing protein [Melioribacteraceae bacterium]|nr:T9SS type A sorting domain-containing protein [Melioribacteraceae bacterium]